MLLWPKNIFFVKKYKHEYKKPQNFCWFQIRWCWLSKTLLKEVKSKNHEKMGKNENSQNSHSFLAIAFIRDNCLSRHQCFFILVLIFFTKKSRHQRFFYTRVDIFHKKNVLGHKSTFSKFKGKCEKLYIFKHFAKSKKYFFANIYHSPFDSH